MLNSLSRRGFLTGAVATGALVGLSACGGTSAGGKTTSTASGNGGDAYTGPSVALTFWNGFTGGDGAFMKKLVDEFNSSHENIKVTMQTMQWSDFYAKLPTAVTAGKAPDIAVMHLDSVATMAARKAVQPLDDVAKALGLSESDFAAVPWKAGVYKDVRYSIPLDVHPMGFFYNKRLMEKAGLDPANPPLTGDDYMSALDKLRSKGIQGHWASPFQFTGGMSVYGLVTQFGGSLFSEDASKATWAEDPGVKAMQWWMDLVKKGYSPAKVAQDADFVAFQNDKCAFNWNGIWSLNTLNDNKKVDWGVAVMPQIGEKKAVWANSHQFTLPTQKSADDNKTQAAKVFVNWVSKKSLEWAKGGQIPARNSVREEAGFKELKGQAILAGQLDYVVFPPAVAGIGDALAEFYKAVNDIMLGGKDVSATLKESADRADKLLEQNKKKYQ
ncbi:ABC transporter substrate-binding protein [Acidipropionibacterium timonense]|uniref:ABC transporter substrate-binding protein n=1 Tax=Acidipropionibacterium timonense TaxID=2161818 RepID=UPI0010320AFC|nr:ABC transporter substrate-binding protein [Acidipropionibacterium timonense]